MLSGLSAPSLVKLKGKALSAVRALSDVTKSFFFLTSATGCYKIGLVLSCCVVTMDKKYVISFRASLLLQQSTDLFVAMTQRVFPSSAGGRLRDFSSADIVYILHSHDNIS